MYDYKTADEKFCRLYNWQPDKQELQQMAFSDTNPCVRNSELTVAYNDDAGLYRTTSAIDLDNELVSAAARGDLELLEHLLREGADPDVAGSVGGSGSALFAAVAEGQAEAAALLIEFGAEVEIRDRCGCTPLALAAVELGDAELAELLVRCGASAAAEYAGRSILAGAVAHNKVEAVAAMLEAGADPVCLDTECSAALFHALYHSRDCFQYLVEQCASLGLDLLEENERGCTLLVEAVSLQQVAAVRLLLKAGMDPLSCATCGRNPLQVARAWVEAEKMEATIVHKPPVISLTARRILAALENAAEDRQQREPAADGPEETTVPAQDQGPSPNTVSSEDWPLLWPVLELDPGLLV